MKRFIAVLSGLLVLPAFAEVAPVYYDEIVEYTDDMLDAEEEFAEEAEQPVAKSKAVNQRNTINRSTSVSRAISSGTSANKTSSRAVASSPRNASNATSRGTVSRTARTSSVANKNPAVRTSVTSRSSQNTKPVTSRSSQNTKPVTARVGTFNNSVMTGNRTVGYSSQKTLEDSGSSLYNANSAAARVGVGSRRATARISTSSLSSAAATPVITEESVSTTTNNLTAIAELTDYCKAQYAACMDNYCNVLDDNQGRCSCSKNIKNYEKTEQALADATESFQDVVQKIKYIGLTSKQIESLFEETEAELKMKSSSDSSNLKNSLDAIKRKIVDVSTPNASSYEASNGMSFDLSGLLDADFTSGFDMSSFLGTGTKNTNNITNQRGEHLYKTATNRCKTAVLNSCTAQGIDANVIANSYDLEIDKQCIAYERSLNEANKEMRNNVTNASSILQQARLMLAQNKNSYDLRGCVAAIDSCMQDDYVCGSDYEYCLDSTGKYISEGSIIPGSMPGVAGGANVNTNLYTGSNWLSGGMYDLYESWNYGDGKNAWGSGDKEFLAEFIDEKVKAWSNGSNYTKPATTSDDMATYLLRKIGYIEPSDSNKVHGMCASAMKQCQDYTFKDDSYKPDNEVIRQYLTTVLTKIKIQQDNLLYNHAENCRSDVSSCLSTNGYDNGSSINKQSINACSLQIATCMSVNGYKPSDRSKLTTEMMSNWALGITCVDGYQLGFKCVESCPAGYIVEDSKCAVNLSTLLIKQTSSDFGYAKNFDGSCTSKPQNGSQTADTNCSFATGLSNAEWKTTFSTNTTGYTVGVLKGTSTCNTVSGTNNPYTTKPGDAFDSKENVGTQCWCKVTGFAPQANSTDFHSVSAAQWVWRSTITSECSSSCASKCADYSLTDAWRNLLLGK